MGSPANQAAPLASVCQTDRPAIGGSTHQHFELSLSFRESVQALSQKVGQLLLVKVYEDYRNESQIGSQGGWEADPPHLLPLLLHLLPLLPLRLVQDGWREKSWR